MAAAGPRYAPEDPTLPKPWRGLVDGRTGNLYFWNPVTNVTQYQRPKDLAPEPDVTEKQSSDAAVSSDAPETDNGVAGDDLRHESSGNGGSELPSETKVDDEVCFPNHIFQTREVSLNLKKTYFRLFVFEIPCAIVLY